MLSTHVSFLGEPVFVRTVTYHYVGRVEHMDDEWIVLSTPSWVADSGRWHEALASGQLSEVECYPEGAATAIARQSVVEVASWPHPLPTESI